MSNTPNDSISRKKLLVIGDESDNKIDFISSIQGPYTSIESSGSTEDSVVASQYRAANRCYIFVNLNQDENTIKNKINSYLTNANQHICHENIIIIGANADLLKTEEYTKKCDLISKFITPNKKKPPLANLNFYTTTSNESPKKKLTYLKNIDDIIAATKPVDITFKIPNTPDTEKKWQGILNEIERNINITKVEFPDKTKKLTISGPGFKHQIEIMALLKKRNNHVYNLNVSIGDNKLRTDTLKCIENKINELQSIWKYIFKRSTAKQQALMEMYRKTYFEFDGRTQITDQNILNPKPFIQNIIKNKKYILNKIEKKISQSQYSLGIFIKRSLEKENALLELYKDIFLAANDFALGQIISDWTVKNSGIINRNLDLNKKTGFFRDSKEIDIVSMLTNINTIVKPESTTISPSPIINEKKIASNSKPEPDATRPINSTIFSRDGDTVTLKGLRPSFEDDERLDRLDAENKAR